MTSLITALDYAEPAAALALVERLEPGSTRLKVGNELFTAAGPALVETLQGRGFDVFLDLKYHDIPNTVAAACARAAALGVWMINVHASGGRRMLEAAREAVPVGGDGSSGTRLIAVTVLTSLERADLAATGLDVEPAEQVRRLVELTRETGLDGVVCSPREIGLVRELVPASGMTHASASCPEASDPHESGADVLVSSTTRSEAERRFLTVTPGVRPRASGESADTGRRIVSRGGASDDQRRTATPREAILAGGDHLVVGRAITQAVDPAVALQAISAEVSEALAERDGSTNEATP